MILSSYVSPTNHKGHQFHKTHQDGPWRWQSWWAGPPKLLSFQCVGPTLSSREPSWRKHPALILSSSVWENMVTYNAGIFLSCLSKFLSHWGKRQSLKAMMRTKTQFLRVNSPSSVKWHWRSFFLAYIHLFSFFLCFFSTIVFLFLLSGAQMSLLVIAAKTT